MLHVFQSLHVVVNNNLQSIGFSDLTNRIYKFGFAYNMYLSVCLRLQYVFMGHSYPWPIGIE